MSEVPDASTASHLVLVGLMGAGKTTVGRECARRLGRPFVDTDDLVVANAGRPIPELFATQGEEGFRALERRAVADACAAPTPCVVACGGGAVVDPESRRRLRAAGFVVWLRAAVPELVARVGVGEDRPLLAAGAPDALTRLARTRAAAYQRVAHVVVDTDDRSVDEVATVVLDEYRSRAA